MKQVNFYVSERLDAVGGNANEKEVANSCRFKSDHKNRGRVVCCEYYGNPL